MKFTFTLFFISILFYFKSHSQILNTESFDGTTFVPTGWTNLLVSGTNTWTRVTAGTFPTQATHSGAGEAQFNSYSVNSGVRALVSPVISYATRGGAATTINFWMYRDNGYNTTADKIDVYMNTNPNLIGANLLGTVNRAVGLTPTVTATGWYQYSFNVPATYSLATNYFILKATSAYGNNMFIDDVSWTSYPPPTIDMMATALINPSSNYSCFGNNQSVSVQIKNNGTTVINFATNPVTINTSAIIAPSNTLVSNSTQTITPYVINNGTLAVGASSNIVITNVFNMTTSGSYTFNASTSVVNDVNTTNDAMTPVVIIVSKVNTYPYETDFSTIPSPTYLTQQVSGTGSWTNVLTGSMTNPSLAPVLNSGNGFAYFNSYSFSSGTISNLITPCFDFSTNLNPILTLWVSQDAGWSGYNDKLDILISTDGGSTWSTSMLTIPRYNASYTTPGWKSFSLPLSVFAGMTCVRIAIKATSAYGNNIAIDYLKIYDGGTFLPVKLIYFSGEKLNDNENLLTWETAEEFNTKLFKVEMSSDGVNFSTVNVQNSMGKQTGKTYFFIDTLEQKTPISYYRLITVDEDNSSEVFKTVAIERNYKKTFNASIYPNPSNGNSDLQIDMENEGEVSIEIIDVNGSLIKSETRNLDKGSNKIELSLDSNDKGIFFVKIWNLKDHSSNSKIKLVII